ncbi:MAG: OPT family oligopeptide transporter [Phycisphaerales bacterium]
MAIQQLTDEQIQTWTREEKDRWWLANVFRGDMPQLTLRAAATGFLIGAIMSATNLYVGAKTGISLGVGLASVIVAFGAFKVLSAMRMAKDFTILENNAMQSIATSAGYMTVPMVSSIVAYMWVKNEVIPWHQIMLWNVVLSIMGVLVAFPMKRRFINDEQQPFPEGRACGVVLDTLYSGSGGSGMLQAKALAVAGLLTAFIQVCAGEAYMKLFWVAGLGRQSYTFLNEKLSDLYFRFWPGTTGPTMNGIKVQDLALWPTLDLAMIGTGGLMGIKTSTSLLVGAVVNFVVLAPWMIQRGDIVGKVNAAGVATYGRAEIVNQWSIWWGVGIMVVGSLVALFAKPKLLIGAFTGMFSKRPEGGDVLGHIELPLKWSFIGLPICAVLTAWMANAWFGVPWLLALLSLPLTFALSLICTNAMALTSWTPTGALSKITQFTFGAIEHTNPATNLMTAGITSEVASNSANLLSDIKPGYMLGAKPRQQAVGHVIGIIAGAAASTPLFFALFMQTKPEDAGKPLTETMVSEQFTFPGALQWKGVADIIAKGFSGLTPSIQLSLGIATVVAVAFELLRIRTKGKFPLSPVGIGLGVVLPPAATFAMFAGSLLFLGLNRLYSKKPGTAGHTLWVQSHEPICAGIIAGAALIGIGDKLIEVFVLPLVGIK